MQHKPKSCIDTAVMPLSWLGSLPACDFQASRVQFVFDDEALEVLIKSKESENKFVGGQNRWAFDSFTNWEFWWKGFPVLVYFKVTPYPAGLGMCHTAHAMQLALF